ncbi:hypothetical protein OS493_012459 [Desmophyllum pertusum]|uniref:Uncharacterized protein n=1 Tax=Desmophyllum pertusum TaxID=174260 RepID=A0A9X0D420_9CNID|nr:hypothetical protein OS493_012459 [Desmophyllum pertusum]
MAVDPLLRLSSDDVINTLRDVGYVVHQMIPEKYRYSETNKAGMFPHPIAIACGQHGKLLFIDFDPLKNNSRLVEAVLHNPVRVKVLKSVLPDVRTLCYLKGVGAAVLCEHCSGSLRVVDLEDKVKLSNGLSKFNMAEGVMNGVVLRNGSNACSNLHSVAPLPDGSIVFTDQDSRQHQPREQHTLQEAHQMVKGVSSYFKSTIDEVKSTRNLNSVTNGPEGTIPSKTATSLVLVEKGLERLDTNFSELSPDFKIKPEVCLTVQVENLHAVSHFKHPTCTLIEYSRDFGNTMHESLKRTTTWSAYYYTHTHSLIIQFQKTN